MSDKHKHEHDKKPVEKTTDWQVQALLNLAGWQKALADYQNLQKETDQKTAALKRFIESGLIEELLPIFDNYSKALEHVPPNERKASWAVGLEHILKLWESFLAEHKIEKIETLGKNFDPRWHESLGQITDEKKPDQSIVEEKQAGYKSGEIILRPAKVIINNISK